MDKNQTEFYRVRLIDYALPSFCDGEVYYYDTADNIRLLFERSLTGKGRAAAERCLAAMDEYLSGQGPGRVWLQYEEPRPLLSRVKFLGKRAWECGPLSYSFYNVWKYRHDITMDGARVDAVYLKDTELLENPLIRCVKLRVKRPGCSDWLTKSAGAPPLSCLDCLSRISACGYPHMIVKKGSDTLMNRLYYPDRSFQTAADLQADMETPYPVDFERLFLEIHGDG